MAMLFNAIMKKKVLIQIVRKILYFLYPINYKNTIWLIGSGRSGTTWISSIINYKGDYRELFEPFHVFIPEMKYFGFRNNLFLDETVQKRGIRILAKLILCGKYYHKRTEGNNKFINHYSSDFIIVKDIFANLLAY